jgi:O-6-methylguanine DNA methyltransferase
LDPCERDPESLRAFCEQPEKYFAGERESSDVALDLQATVFRRRVWQALRELPYGHVTTYGRLARELSVSEPDDFGPGARPATAARKDGWAIGATPAPIIVPCHRAVQRGTRAERPVRRR